MQNIILKLEKENLEVLLYKNVTCFLLSSNLRESFLVEFHQKALLSEKIVLIEGENAVDLCIKLDLDGVIVDFSKSESLKEDIEHIKSTLKNKILGVISRPRRHEAMIISENNPDFLIFKVWQDGFENLTDLIKWYMELFIIQNAAYVQEEISQIKEITSDIIILNQDLYKILVEK